MTLSKSCFNGSNSKFAIVLSASIFEFQLSMLFRVTAIRNLHYNLDQFSNYSDENKQTIE